MSYKQCITVLESSSANMSSADLDVVKQKCNEATMCSRRIHSLIQMKYDEARHGSKPSKNTPPPSFSPSSSGSDCDAVTLSYLLIRV